MINSFEAPNDYIGKVKELVQETEKKDVVSQMSVNIITKCISTEVRSHKRSHWSNESGAGYHSREWCMCTIGIWKQFIHQKKIFQVYIELVTSMFVHRR